MRERGVVPECAGEKTRQSFHFFYFIPWVAPIWRTFVRQRRWRPADVAKGVIDEDREADRGRGCPTTITRLSLANTSPVAARMCAPRLASC